MKKGDYISAILRSKKTVFSFKDIALLWRDGSSAARVRINYYIKNNDLRHIRRGLYAKDEHYDRFELATRIFTPAYVSFETVLAQKGVTFQYYSQIFSASYLTREITIDNQIYSFRKIKDSVLTSVSGLEDKGEYLQAGKERAFLDALYSYSDYYFDNLTVDWNKVFEILPIYDNKNMEKKVKKLYDEQQRSA